MRPDSKAKKVARGRVWVRPGRLPAKVMVAPNSPSARAHESASPDKMAGRASGRVMLPNTRQLLAPSVRATSASFGSLWRMPVSTLMTKNGKATKAAATTAPAVVNGSDTPHHLSIHWPTSPLRPRANSRAAPPTTGGSTIGSSTSTLSTRRVWGAAAAIT